MLILKVEQKENIYNNQPQLSGKEAGAYAHQGIRVPEWFGP